MGPTLFLLYINDLFDCLPPDSVIAYADDTTLIASGPTAHAAETALQTLLNTVYQWSTDNCLHLNPAKCLSMIIAPSKQKAAAAASAPRCAPRINGSAVSTATSIKILGVIFTSELEWQEQARAVRAKVARKLAVLQRIGGTLNTRTRAQFYKTCIKPHIDYCLPVWAHCGAEQAKLDRTLTRAKQTIANSRCANIEKTDFKHFCLATFTDLTILAIACQYFNHVHSEDFNANISLLSQINKSMSTRASLANKSFIQISKKSCDNCFLYSAPKLWNSLPNSVTSQVNFSSFYQNLIQYVFPAAV